MARWISSSSSLREAFELGISAPSSEISKRVPKSLDVIFDELSIDRQIIRMRVYAESFESADLLGAELAKFPPFAQARIGSIESDPKRGGKRFDVTISLAPLEDSV